MVKMYCSAMEDLVLGRRGRPGVSWASLPSRRGPTTSNGGCGCADVPPPTRVGCKDFALRRGIVSQLFGRPPDEFVRPEAGQTPRARRGRPAGLGYFSFFFLLSFLSGLTDSSASSVTTTTVALSLLV